MPPLIVTGAVGAVGWWKVAAAASGPKAPCQPAPVSPRPCSHRTAGLAALDADACTVARRTPATPIAPDAARTQPISTAVVRSVIVRRAPFWQGALEADA